MKRSVLSKDVVPLALLFTGLVLATLLLDALLHQWQLVWIGRYLGIPGVLLILVSMRYSLRKRKYIQSGNPLQLLKRHKTLAWLGSLLVLVHAGIHFNAILPWLAVAAMLVNVASGLTGSYLLGRARSHLESRRKQLLDQGLDAEAVETQLLADSATLDLLKKWRLVHLPIALAFASLALAHILSIFLFWGWR
jgi:hypothetical protein